METKASFKKIVDFLSNLGEQHINIKKTVRWNKLELAGSFKHNNSLSVMLIDSIETNVDKPKNATFNRNQVAFTILGQEGFSTAKIDSYSNQNQVLEHCQQIAFEIAARLMYECENAEGDTSWLYAAIKPSSFHFYKVGPVFTENLYGYRCEFVIDVKECYKVDATKWNDIEE